MTPFLPGHQTGTRVAPGSLRRLPSYLDIKRELLQLQVLWEDSLLTWTSNGKSCSSWFSERRLPSYLDIKRKLVELQVLWEDSLLTWTSNGNSWSYRFSEKTPFLPGHQTGTRGAPGSLRRLPSYLDIKRELVQLQVLWEDSLLTWTSNGNSCSSRFSDKTLFLPGHQTGTRAAPGSLRRLPSRDVSPL